MRPRYQADRIVERVVSTESGTMGGLLHRPEATLVDRLGFDAVQQLAPIVVTCFDHTAKVVGTTHSLDENRWIR